MVPITALQNLANTTRRSNLCRYFCSLHLIGQASTLAVSIDAPIKILLADVDEKFVPERFRKINSRGVPVTGYQLTALLVGILIIVPALGIGDMTSLYNCSCV